MNFDFKAPQWSENVIIADGDYVDRVAFNLIVNFERMIGRRIPNADMARWLDCIALDGGLREGAGSVQAIFIHSEGKAALDNFTPGNYSDALDGKAFRDHLGEFLISAVEAKAPADPARLFVESAQLVCAAPEVKRVMLIPDADRHYDELRHALRRVADDKCVTVFAMEPMPGGNFRQEILGYSLMSALGIRADEIKQD